jgi:hypothetical protein
MMMREVSLEGSMITKLLPTVHQHQDYHHDDVDNDDDGDEEGTDMLLGRMCYHH